MMICDAPYADLSDFAVLFTHILNSIKMMMTIGRLLVFSLILTVVWLSPNSALAQSASGTEILFRLDMRSLEDEAASANPIGIRGNIAPLSWEQTTPLRDEDQDGIYTGWVRFPESNDNRVLEYKFIYGEETWELARQENRFLLLSPGKQKLPISRWDVAEPLPEAVRRAFSSLDPQDLIKDLDLLERAMTALHPGLYRYARPEEVAGWFAAASQQLEARKAIPLSEAYLLISRLVARIRCGHTYANFYNQSDVVEQLLFLGQDKLPFTFRIIDDRMILTQNLSGEDRLTRGTEITAINGLATQTILRALSQLVKADGGNDGKRAKGLEVQGYGDFEPFDIYFPLMFPPENGQFALEYRPFGESQSSTTRVAAVTSQARAELLEQRYGAISKQYEDLWEFKLLNNQLAYLRLGTFVVWKMEMDWKAFLKDAFRELKARGIPNLVVDIRGNEGGAGEVYQVLGQYLVSEKTSFPAYLSRVRYQRVPDDLRPYLRSWSDEYYDLSAEVVPAEDGYFRQLGE